MYINRHVTFVVGQIYDFCVLDGLLNKSIAHDITLHMLFVRFICLILKYMLLYLTRKWIIFLRGFPLIWGKKHINTIRVKPPSYLCVPYK